MGANESFVAYIKELLTPLMPLDSGVFFGGYAFKKDGKQFAMIIKDTLYFCVNDKTRKHYQNLQMVPFSYQTKKGKITVNKYFSVPEHVFEEPDEFITWANEAIGAAHSYK